MISDAAWLIVFAVCVFYGLRSPSIALATVFFADILKPQNLSFGFLSGKPISLSLTLILALSIFLNIRSLKRPEKLTITVLLTFFIGWITYTTNIAEFQGPAWFKYDYVVKTIIVTLAIPFILNTRLKIELVLAMILAGIAYYVLIGGIRTALGQASYTTLLVPTAMGDSELAETSTLSMVAVFTIPFALYLRNHSIFRFYVPGLRKLMLLMVVACLFTVVGTYARTGLVGLAFLFALYFMSSKYKGRIVISTLIVGISLIALAPKDYLNRMETLENATEESSALGRILVWRWTLDYVKERPITGGGFDSYIANAGELNQYLQSDVHVSLPPNKPKAFHNIFFEVLGEHGYPGLIIYVSIIFLCLTYNRKIIKQCNENEPVPALAKMLNYAIMIYCLCGLFIGVAYAPWLFYFAGLSAALQNLVNEKQTKIADKSLASNQKTQIA